jgi:hypothetical protein
MACFFPTYTAQNQDPPNPINDGNGTARGIPNRFSGMLEVSTYAFAAGSFSAWAHVGQDVIIEPAARQLIAFVAPSIEFWVKAESWFGSYYSSEALAHLILWNNRGVEVIHEVRSLFRAVAPFWWYVDSGGNRVSAGMVSPIARPASTVRETWHIAFGLQAFAGGGGFGGCHAIASGTVGRMCVSQFDSRGALII